MAINKGEKLIEDVARRSGLKEMTVRELLHAGYSYVEHIYEPPRWVQDRRFRR